MLFPTAGGGLYVRNEMFRTGPGAGALNDASGGAIAQSFVTSYFQIFDSDRRGLAAIYVRVGGAAWFCRHLPPSPLPWLLLLTVDL